MARGAGDASGLPWYSIALGYPVLGIWYWCCDQTIVQRVLAAKDERNARLGPLFCAFLKVLPVFFFVLPGVICVALVQRGAFGGAAPATAADTYTFMLTHLLPVGLKGLVAAAMLAAAMQTCSAALNSTATLVAYDLWKRWRPGTPDAQLVTVGKITTVAGTVLAIVCSPLFGHYSTIFEGINKLISYVAPPITAVFLLGVFWKGAAGKPAFATLLGGSLLGLAVFVLDWTDVYRGDFSADGVLPLRDLRGGHGGAVVAPPGTVARGGAVARLGQLARAAAAGIRGSRRDQLPGVGGAGGGGVRRAVY